MTGAIAGAKGNIPEAYAKTAYQILKPSLRAVLDEFEKTLSERSLLNAILKTRTKEVYWR